VTNGAEVRRAGKALPEIRGRNWKSPLA